MAFKDKIMNIITAHPKLVTLGIGLAVTFIIGTAIGSLDHNQIFAIQGHRNSVAIPAEQ